MRRRAAGVALVAASGLAAWFWPTVCVVTPASQVRECASNLKQIGLALDLYARRNSGSLPGRDGTEFLSALYECHVLEDPRVYLCPSSGETVALTGRLEPRGCSYIGRRNAGQACSPPTPTDAWRVLAVDRSPDHHGGSRNALFADGHVESIEEDEYRRRHAAEMGR